MTIDKNNSQKLNIIQDIEIVNSCTQPWIINKQPHGESGEDIRRRLALSKICNDETE